MQEQADVKARVYVVDDDPNFLTALRRLLSAEGYDVAAFDSPAAFLAAHDPARPGCLLLDMQMAEMDGLDVQARLLAGAGGWPNIRRSIIFITGEASIPASVTAMKRGARDYLTKPVDPKLLLAAVREAIAEDARRRAAQIESGPVESWETAVTGAGDIALSFMAGGQGKPADPVVCDREAAMGIAKDILLAVARSDPPPERVRPDLSVFVIREPMH